MASGPVGRMSPSCDVVRVLVLKLGSLVLLVDFRGLVGLDACPFDDARCLAGATVAVRSPSVSVSDAGLCTGTAAVVAFAGSLFDDIERFGGAS